jgi:periplasmic divalent cation tolerance protein
MADPKTDFRLVLTTAGSDEQAVAIARGLVERRLAACVNVVGNVCSIYRWKGKAVQEGEKLLLIKTEKRLLPELRAAIRELHSYEVPEVIALPINDGDPDYLGWLAGCLKP